MTLPYCNADHGCCRIHGAAYDMLKALRLFKVAEEKSGPLNDPAYKQAFAALRDVLKVDAK
jgi:hypothetical protein